MGVGAGAVQPGPAPGRPCWARGSARRWAGRGWGRGRRLPEPSGGAAGEHGGPFSFRGARTGMHRARGGGGGAGSRDFGKITEGRREAARGQGIRLKFFACRNKGE